MLPLRARAALAAAQSGRRQKNDIASAARNSRNCPLLWV
jgi:hypothetical protein